jgi:hypothetical protein
MCPTEDSKRGVIRNRSRAQQIRDFHGLKWGKITPTDIDCFVDFGKTVMVFVEYKRGNFELSIGQRLALERIVEAINDCGYVNCICIKAVHDTPDTNNDIDAANALVVSIYDKSRKWNELDGSRTVKETIDSFLKDNGKGYLVD